MVHPYIVVVHFLVLTQYRTASVQVFSWTWQVQMYAPNTAINGDMGWSMPQRNQWICMQTDKHEQHIANQKNFTACSQIASSRCKTWFYRVGQLLVSIDHAYFLSAENVNTRSVLLSLEVELKVISDIVWKEKLTATSAIRGNAQSGNKLRTYSQFKHEYGTEPYVTIITRKCYRSDYAKFRCGVAPINIKTCRLWFKQGTC